jgi:hypothetical protein
LRNEKHEPLTLGLLQGCLDIGAMVILSLLYFIWAGRTLLGFCLFTCTFISLFSSGSGRTQQLFQPCKQALPVVGNPSATPCSDSTSLNFEVSNRPTHITAHLQAHKANTQKPTCKRAVILPHTGHTLLFDSKTMTLIICDKTFNLSIGIIAITFQVCTGRLKEQLPK